MELTDVFKIEGTEVRHRLSTTRQTGFPSPATHYLEPKIDLNKELIINRDATFFIRVQGELYQELGIYDKDVLIVDRSLKFKNNNLGIVVQDGEFKIMMLHASTDKDPFEFWGLITYVIHAVK